MSMDKKVQEEAPLRLHEIEPQTVSRRILIVDDETFNQIGLKNLIMTLPKFKHLQKLIDTAQSGEECLKMAQIGLT